jgi:hypothetical protein
MTLPRESLEKLIHCRVAAVKALSIMRFRDWLLVPVGKDHARFRLGLGIEAIAAFSLAFGEGGFSRRSSTRRLSRSDSTIRSDSAITA